MLGEKHTSLLILFLLGGFVWIHPVVAQPAASSLLQYHHPGATTDLGIGLWPVPCPLDWDGDGDIDLVLLGAGRPYNGTYLFLNDGQDTFFPGIRVGDGPRNAFPSYVNGELWICEPGKVHKNIRENLLQHPEKIPFKQDFYAGRDNQWRFADYDGDGVLDLLIGTSDWRDYGWDNAYDKNGVWTNGTIHGSVYWVKNYGSNETPVYQESQPIYAGNKPLEVFGAPSPNLVDWDRDGDLDLLCGEFLDQLTYFQNIGTREKPEYTEGQFLRIDQKILQIEIEMMQVVLFDWDGDGDLDILVGQEDGRVILIESLGTDQAGFPQFKEPVFLKQYADKLKCGALVTPCSSDWDGDGDEDLICGNTAGYLEWIENLGCNNTSTPCWAPPQRLTAEGKEIRYMAGKNLSIQGPAEAKWGYTVPYVADWDNDGLPDILLNNIIGQIVWHKNIGTRSEPRLSASQPIRVAWEQETPKPDWTWWNPQPGDLVVQWRTRPVVMDLNQDGLNDLILMDHEGYLSFFERRKTEAGELILLPGKRIFLDDSGNPLKLSQGDAGKSGRRKIDLVDWDGDGDLDLLINSPGTSPAETRNIAYYENIASATEPFVSQYKFQYKGDITSDGLEGHTTCPTTVDWNQDGIRDLLVGAEDGFFYFYERHAVQELTGNTSLQK